MSDLKKKTSFSNIWKLLLDADTRLGLHLLKDPSEKKTLKNWIYQLTMARSFIMVPLLFVSTCITTNFSLISVIFCTSLGSIFIGLYTALYHLVMKKKNMMNLLAWCEDLYDVKKKFHLTVQNFAETHLISIEKKSSKVLKLLRSILYCQVTVATFGFVILGMILPESIIPKYTLPAPFYLPFKHQDNWRAFLVTVTLQIIVLFDGATMTIFIFSLFSTVVNHILGYLDLIYEVTKYLKLKLKKSFEVESESQSTLDIEVLESINKSLDQNNEFSFDDYIKILTEMISDVSLMTSLCSKFYSMTFLLLEIASFASLFLCGLIFIIVRQQYIFAVAILNPTTIFWIICYINEKILEKFEDIQAKLYDISWYELDPKQRKILIIALNCDKIQKGFTVAGLHNLTMERFAAVLKAGYTNLLVLKDLVQK